MLKNDWEFHRGDIYYANLNPFLAPNRVATARFLSFKMMWAITFARR
jgi:hypothetical protein